MNKETLEAASRLLGLVIGELGFSPEFAEGVRRTIDRMVDELSQRAAAPEGPTLTDELTAESQRAIYNIAGIAHLVLRMGAPPEHVRELVRGHLLKQAAGEQQLVHALLALPHQVEASKLH